MRTSRSQALLLAALPAIACFALALTLRLYAIDRQSLWYDEGLSAALAQRPPARIIRDALRGVHPPLYHLTLHAWTRLFGTSEVALRSLSAVCGALTAGATAVLGRRWFGGTAGAVAGLAVAVSPLAVHYGQETRMYALATLLSTLLWLAVDRRRKREPGWLALYAAAALAALVTHYFTGTVVAAAFLGGLLLAPSDGDQRRAHAGWLGLHLALGAVYLPLVWNSRVGIGGWTATERPTPPLFILRDTLRAFSQGLHPLPEAMPWIAGFVLLLIAGLAGALRGSDRRAVAAAVLWLALPLAAIVVLSLRQPYYQPRFLLPALPAFALLLGAGARTVGQILAGRVRYAEPLAGVAAAALLLAASAAPLWREWTDPAVWRDDYRGVARAIAATASADDAVLLVAPGQAEILDYYLDLPLPRYGLPRTRPLDVQETVRELEAIAGRHRRLYGVFYVPYEADPAGEIRRWLNEHAFTASSRWYGGVELVIYELPEVAAPPQMPEARFAEAVRLRQIATEPAELRPGDAVRIEAEWSAEEPVGRQLLVFVHMLDAAGQVVAQFDGPPAPLGTDAWQPGGVQRGRMAVLVPPGTPGGVYRLVTGLYDPATGERLLLPDGSDTLPLTEVRVLP